MPRDEWNAEGIRLFGPRVRDWRFRCPKCGEISTPADFHALGIDQSRAGELAAVNCIGRHTDARGCDWSAGGLFGTLNEGVEVVEPATGERICLVFSFAPVEPEADET